MNNLINNENILSHRVNKTSKLFLYLKSELVLSFRQTTSLMKNNNLLINNKIVKKNITVNEDDIITLLFEDELNNYERQDIKLDILYESYDLLIINKQPNIVIHPTKSHPNNTIANAVSYYFSKNNLKRKIRFINRLDMDTSGILIIAKNAYAHQFLAKQFENDQVTKQYLAIVDSEMKNKQGVIIKSIAKNEDNLKYEINNLGKKSKTIYKVINENKFPLVLCELKSGRTHQIRVHLESLGVHIVGDVFYYENSDYINRQALHSYKLIFKEPRTNIIKTIVCELPDDMKKLLEYDIIR